MLDFEASDDGVLEHFSDEDEPEEEFDRRYFHILCLVDAGLMTNMGPGQFRMTNAGHDFCAAIRDDTIWTATKQASAKVSGVGLSMLKDIGLAYLRRALIDSGVPL